MGLLVFMSPLLTSLVTGGWQAIINWKTGEVVRVVSHWHPKCLGNCWRKRFIPNFFLCLKPHFSSAWTIPKMDEIWRNDSDLTPSNTINDAFTLCQRDWNYRRPWNCSPKHLHLIPKNMVSTPQFRTPNLLAALFSETFQNAHSPFSLGHWVNAKHDPPGNEKTYRLHTGC